MADTFTTNLNLTKPEPGAAEDTWGISLNSDLDTLDAIFSSSGTQINLNPNQVNFADGKKAIFGTGSDLEIYHDGSNSNIVDTGTGYLSLRGTDLRLQDSTGWNFVICTDLGQGGEVALLHSNIEKLKTTASGIDVTGTVTSDGLTVDGNGTVATFNGSTATNIDITEGDTTDVNTRLRQTAGQLLIQTTNDAQTTGTSRFLINHSTGDISFYDDTGTTQGLFWDASAESLAIGTTSPAERLTVSGNQNITGKLAIGSASAHPSFDFYNQNTAYFNGAVTIDDNLSVTNGSVGIGTSSPSSDLEVDGEIGITNFDALRLGVNHGNGATIAYASNGNLNINPRSGYASVFQSGNVGIGAAPSTHTLELWRSGGDHLLLGRAGVGTYELGVSTDNALTFEDGGSERMRIDSAGNLMVSTTNGAPSLTNVAGIVLRSEGHIYASRDGGVVSYLNRMTTDGTILDFRKDGTNVGNIATNNDDLLIYSTATGHKGLRFAGGEILPVSNAGALEDNTTDLGSTAYRFKDLHLSRNANLGSSNYLRFTAATSGSDASVLFGNSAGTGGSLTFKRNSDSTVLATVKADGNVGIGTTAPSTALTVVGDVTVSKTAAGSNILSLQRNGATNPWKLAQGHTATDYFEILEGNDVRLTIKNGGNVGIGANAPQAKLEIRGSESINGFDVGAILSEGLVNTSSSYLVLGDQQGVALRGVHTGTFGRKALAFYTSNNTDSGNFDPEERMRITSAGNVGIGTDSPARALDVNGTARLADGSSLEWGGVSANIAGSSSTDTLFFRTASTERARIDLSGNLLVGTTSTTPAFGTGNGTAIRTGEMSHISRSGGTTLAVNRASNDGDIVSFRQDGANIGSIGVTGTDFYIGRASSSSLRFQGAGIRPSTGASLADDTYELGGASARFTNLHLSGGVKGEYIASSLSGADVGLRMNSNPSLRAVIPVTSANAVVDDAIDLGYSGGRFKDLYLSGTPNIWTTDTGGEINFRRIDSTININNNIGTISFNGTEDSGTTILEGAKINAYSAENWTNSTAASYLTFSTTSSGSITSTERMRIDSSGNLLVGKTAASVLAEGVEARPSGTFSVIRDDGQPMYVGRKTSDGTLIDFRKDGTTVGNIGVSSGTIYIDGGSGSTGLYFGSSNIYPRDNGAAVDNAVDLGHGSYRFKDIYASNGTIQTSDINEKQDIEDLSEAETRVAVAVKGLLKKYRWKSAVADKGDDARIHFGIMAQDLENAFANEGLDAGDYGMFISSTWTDEATGEEKTRLGVRYNELLAFIIAAI